MAFLGGRTARRLAWAIGLTAALPLAASIYFAGRLVDKAFAQAFPPELGQHLDRSLGVYQELARATKEAMRSEADALSASATLRAAAARGDVEAVAGDLARKLGESPHLASLAVRSADGAPLVTRDRGRPLDEKLEVKLDLERPLGEGADAPRLALRFVTPRARFDELAEADAFTRAYHAVARERTSQRIDLQFFVAMLVGTILVAIAIATLLARSVTRRIGELAAATQQVATGDLGVRVVERGDDELTELSRAFNRMVGEVEESRARIEFLHRMGAWQEMARRLAHEIKNPLTPILLAVEECHRKYAGDDPAYRKLIDTTHEIVDEEVGTLRRLVGEFSSFARLPRAHLVPGDLAVLLGDEAARAAPWSDDGALADDELAGVARVTWRVPTHPMPADLDAQMLHRVLANLVRNAAQAIRDARGHGEVEVHADEERDAWVVLVDDDGPGVPPELRATIFDPYVTTKHDGTGLGLAIVKKIVVEHGGTIDVGASPLGGARVRLRLPRPGTPAALAAHEASLRGDVGGSGRPAAA